MSVTGVESLEEYQQILSSNEIVAVDFYASWCKPCAQLSPLYNECSKKYPNVKFLKVEYDAAEEIVELECVEKLPTLKLFSKGKQVSSFIGVKVEELEGSLRNLISEQSSKQQTTEQVTVIVDEEQKSTVIEQKPQVQIGSNVLNLPPIQPEFTQFVSTLSKYSIILFYSSQQPLKQFQTVKSSIQNLITKNPTSSQAQIILTDVSNTDPTTKALIDEYGIEKLSKLPIIKLLYNKTVFYTITQGNIEQLESAYSEFAAL